MQYILVYETKNALNRQQLVHYLQTWGINYNQILSNSYLCITNIQRVDLYNQIRTTMNTDSDLLLIADFNRTSISGWLPNSSVNWFKENIH